MCFQMTVHQICLGYLYFSHCRYVRKFHGERIPSDSEIVPDIEVDKDFQDESKTLLKSKPLKNRSIQMFTTYCLPWSWMSMMMIHLWMFFIIADRQICTFSQNVSPEMWDFISKPFKQLSWHLSNILCRYHAT